MRNALNVRRGFTLIELSIVLVIIGLIVGGVLVGRDMIRAAELRKTHKEFEYFVAAANTFRTKYNCVPGDCPNATTFFGAYGSCPDLIGGGFDYGNPAMIATDPPGDLTCNGDNDRRIDANNTFYEMLTLWQHLGSAQLIPGTYSGGLNSGDSLFYAGVNCPAVGANSNMCWMFLDGDHSTFLTISGFTSIKLIPDHIGTIMGTIDPNSVATRVTHAMSPAEAFGYDSKYDDGSPVKGIIQSAVDDPVLDEFPCTDAPNPTTADAANRNALYLASDDAQKNQPGCSLLYRTGF